MNYIGDFTTADTVYVMFHTFDSNDPSASVTLTGLAVTDIEIYKDGSVTQRSSDAGYTLLDTDGIDFDSITGIHGFSIDLSDNTDAGFFAAGSDYHVVVSSVTVDAATINFIAAHFSIENRSDTAKLSDIESSLVVVTSDLVVITSDTTAIHSQTTVIESDTTQIQSDAVVIEAWGLSSVASDAAAVESELIVVHSETTVIQSDTVVIESDTTAIETGVPTNKYSGPYGPGVYIDSGAGNTNTTTGTDGIVSNPVSTFVAARTIADAIGVKTYYVYGNTDATLAATHEDWTFYGMGAASTNIINLGSQDVDRSEFHNVTIEGTQGGTQSLHAFHCILQDPGAGNTTLRIRAFDCGILDEIHLTNNDTHVFENCFSMVAGGGAPIIDFDAGANADANIRHYSGGVELAGLSATSVVSVETDGQVIFNADCNTSATVALRGMMTITDNTGGMSALTIDSVYDKRSDITQIASDTTKIESDVIVIDAAVSDVESSLVIIKSDLILIDQDNSDIKSDLVIITSDTTGIHSDTAQITNIASDTAVIEGDTATIAAIWVDTNELQGDWTNGGRLDLLIDRILSDTTIIESDSVVIESDVIIMSSGLVTGACEGSPSTTVIQTDLAEATDDHYIGRIVVFTSGAALGQATDITDYTGSTGTITVTALTTAPSASDTFVIY